MDKVFLVITALFFGAFSLSAQCVDFAFGPYTTLGAAPCDGTTKTSSDEVYASEAYLLTGVLIGGEYEVNVCTGTGAGSWINDFSIVSPSGSIDAFGAGDVDGCTISWIASESGAYTIIINEADSCGIANTISNGFLEVTSISGGADCPMPPVFVEGAESFEGEDLPLCWMTSDEDGDGNDWNLVHFAGFDGEGSMRSESFIGPNQVLTPDNYLITPKLQMGAGNDSLYYVVASIDSDYPAENYTVLVSTTGTAIADFTDEVFSEALSSTAWEGRSIDLSAYANQSIYIAFRHHDVSDEYAFLIDAVALPGIVNCNPDGVFNAGKLQNINIYPNPSIGVFNILNSGAADTYQIRVFDITGKLIVTEQLVLTNGGQYTIDMTTAANGIYTVQFVSTQNTGSLRIVKN